MTSWRLIYRVLGGWTIILPFTDLTVRTVLPPDDTRSYREIFDFLPISTTLLTASFPLSKRLNIAKL